jgi:hypothetical protein
VDEDVRWPGVDHRVVTTADLSAFAQGMEDALEPREQAVRIQTLGRHVDPLVAERAGLDDRRDELLGIGAGEAGVACVVPLHWGADGVALEQI